MEADACRRAGLPVPFDGAARGRRSADRVFRRAAGPLGGGVHFPRRGAGADERPERRHLRHGTDHVPGRLRYGAVPPVSVGAGHAGEGDLCGRSGPERVVFQRGGDRRAPRGADPAGAALPPRRRRHPSGDGGDAGAGAGIRDAGQPCRGAALAVHGRVLQPGVHHSGGRAGHHVRQFLRRVPAGPGRHPGADRRSAGAGL